MNNKPSSNINPIKKLIILPQNPTTIHIEKKNYLGIKITTRETKTMKQILKNNSQNTNSLSHAFVYKILCQNYNKSYIGETSRNLNTRIYKHKKRL